MAALYFAYLRMYLAKILPILYWISLKQSSHELVGGENILDFLLKFLAFFFMFEFNALHYEKQNVDDIMYSN